MAICIYNENEIEVMLNMQTVEKLHKAYERGDYDGDLARYYGDHNVERQRKRYVDALYFFGATYGWSRKISMYSVPYSVMLAGDGCDVSIPTDIDALMLVADNGTNVSRTRFRSFTGEDNIDLYQYGPYTSEYGIITGLVRGVQQSFKRSKYMTYGIDMYVDADTLPGIGLDEAAHIAMGIGFVFNDVFNKNKLTTKQVADAVQWALANYMLADSYATGIYSSFEGKTMLGDFSNAENPTVKPIDLDMCGCSMFTVNIGNTSIDIPEAEVDSRIDKLIDVLGASPDEMAEGEFYSKIAEKKIDDKEALLYLLDYYTQENFSNIYAENSDDGVGAPVVEKSIDPLGETLDGAVKKWHSKPYDLYWMTLCCVSNVCADSFKKAMETVYGEGCVTKVGVARKPAARLSEAGGRSYAERVYFVE